jgi:hypothetical protein
MTKGIAVRNQPTTIKNIGFSGKLCRINPTRRKKTSNPTG